MNINGFFTAFILSVIFHYFKLYFDLSAIFDLFQVTRLDIRGLNIIIVEENVLIRMVDLNEAKLFLIIVKINPSQTILLQIFTSWIKSY